MAASMYSNLTYKELEDLPKQLTAKFGEIRQMSPIACKAIKKTDELQYRDSEI